MLDLKPLLLLKRVSLRQTSGYSGTITETFWPVDQYQASSYDYGRGSGSHGHNNPFTSQYIQDDPDCHPYASEYSADDEVQPPVLDVTQQLIAIAD